MGQFEIVRDVHASPERVWRVVTDWSGFARWMPLTTMRTDSGPSRVGFGFAGLSGIGRLRFADSMVVTQWSPPARQASGEVAGRYRVRKTGRLLAGWAVVDVTEGDRPGWSRLSWVEDIVLRPAPLGRLVEPVADLGNRLMFGRAVARMVREAESAAGAAPADPSAAPTADPSAASPAGPAAGPGLG